MSQLTQIQFLHISIPISSSRHGHPNPLKSGRRRPPQRERKPKMERRKTRSQRERRQRKERKIRKGRTRKERMERMEKIMLMKMMSRTQRNFDAMLSNRPRRQVSLMQLTPLIFFRSIGFIIFPRPFRIWTRRSKLPIPRSCRLPAGHQFQIHSSILDTHTHTCIFTYAHIYIYDGICTYRSRCLSLYFIRSYIYIYYIYIS